jgi:iron-sulfur cluster repair protein YtfE (RIC family)
MAQNTTAPGEHLLEELKWVHDMLRKDLLTIRSLAERVGSGATPAVVRSTIRQLQTQSPLWQLRVNCMRYCQFVHHHHSAESAMLFPALRRADPKLGPTVDRLEADHRKVSDLLDQTESLADLLGSDDTPDTRKRLVLSLRELSTHLLEHLDFEEESIAPALRQWRNWPWFG